MLGLLFISAFGVFCFVLFVLGYDSSFFLAVLGPRIQLCNT